MFKRLGKNLVVALLIITALLLSCVNLNQKVVTEAALREPSYHLMPARAELVRVFYETPEKVGFQVYDGIFLYNHQEERMEASFALSEGCFPRDYLISPVMARDEKSILIGGMDHSRGRMSEHYYRYDIATQQMVRIEGDMTKEEVFPFPNEDRQVEAFKADSWNVEDLLYYPLDSKEPLAPFKVEEIPINKYVALDKGQDNPFPPRLILMEDGRFQFIYSLLSSYLNYGKYTSTDNEYIMVTNDGRYTYVFCKKGKDHIFDARRSSRCILDDRTELDHGTVFYLQK